MLTDPADGRLIERTLSSYRPDADMRRQVIAADVYSRAPGNRTPATTCELDQVQPWTGGRDGGLTGELNLVAVHKSAHQHKTDKHWTVTINTARDLTWTTLLSASCPTRTHDYRQCAAATHATLARHGHDQDHDGHGDITPGDPAETQVRDDVDVHHPDTGTPQRQARRLRPWDTHPDDKPPF